jgi:16S rRNA (adenine1518-N6/adenine1519-N6)-dimethyltransferase
LKVVPRSTTASSKIQSSVAKASRRGGASRPKTHAPRKRFGQNFLVDQSVISAIARAINPHKDDNIVEIGPGQGALTDALFESGCTIKAIEIDRDLQSQLRVMFFNRDFTLFNYDALKFNFNELSNGAHDLRIVGNLPYNISTPLIFKLLTHLPVISDMHFMLQKEVVDRLAALPGNKHWGRLSVMTQVDCDVEHLFDVPPEAFYPQPKVQSAIVRLTPKMTAHRTECSREELGKLVQLAFSQRRKTLRNNLRGVIDDAVMQRLGIDPACRAETLTLDQLMDLSLELPQAAI